jgi:hypothetical protein
MLVALCTLTGFGLGRLSKIADRKTPITIELPTNSPMNGDLGANILNSIEKYVASKNGTKYYYPWCDGVKKISPKNLVEFKSKEEAESAGFTKAANCPGL